MENAILMASGMGTRMRPLTETTPKPLITVGDRPMIETIIEGLNRRKLNQIILVVGYLGEQFEYLKNKYNNITIVKNTDYEKVNNISSVYVAKEILLKGSCFICEADLYVGDLTVFEDELMESCYYGKMVKGYSDDWVFDLNGDGIITRIGRCGIDCYNMTGIAYFTEHDARVLYSVLKEEYGKEGYEALFWDDVVNKYINKFRLTVHPINEEQIIEIDTVDELKAVRKKVTNIEVKKIESRKFN